MKGIQESVSYQGHVTKKVDLFCGSCFRIIKMDQSLKVKSKYVCPGCGEINTFDKSDNIRDFHEKKYHLKYPIVYWALKYNIPVNSCYMAFRRRGIGIKRKLIGEPVMMSNREFLAAVVYTRHGQDLIHKLIKTEKLLTDNEIKTIL
jgi:predicted RNA-binding Zn-ribbon protein involved in translation (DUF1610 family)